MSKKINKVCRFCLEEVLDSNIELINNSTNEMLDILLITLDLDVNKESVMCGRCSKTLHQSFGFKSLCLFTESIITPYVQDNLKDSLWDIYVKEKGNDLNTNFTSHEICRFCMECPRNGAYVYLKDTDEYLIRDMIKNFLPEMNMDATEQQPIICEACQMGLENYFTFIRKYLDISEVHDTIIECKIEITENEIKIEEIDNESDAGGNNTLQDRKSTYTTEVITSNKKDRNKYRNTVTQKRHLCQICNSRFKTRYALHRHMILHQSSSAMQVYECDECSYRTKHKYGLACHKQIRHTDPSKQKFFKCDFCQFESKYQANLRRHVLTHKRSLQRLKFASERPKFKCPECFREVVTKETLKIHMLMHKLNSEMPWYRCTKCPYKAKDNKWLTEHVILTHKKQKIYTCEVCTYVTNRKQSFQNHSLIHKDESEIQMYGCDKCTFETKYKYQLIEHLRIHSDIKIYTLYLFV